MNPLISIIVPIYEVECYLQKCIDSILNQTFTNFELILVDDGSPDNCGMICDEYAKKDKRIKVVHKENGGLSSARNAGLEMAQGEYIGFVDSDDFINKNMYEVLTKAAINYTSDIVVCDFVKVNTYDQILCENNVIKEINIQHFTNIDALNQIYSIDNSKYVTGAGNNINWIIVCNKLYKRHLFNGIKFYEGRICEDEFIIHKLLYKSKKVTYLPMEFYYYFQRPNSIIGSPYTIKRFDKVYALKDRVDFFRTIKQRGLCNLALSSYLEAFFWNYFIAKDQLSNVHQELKELKSTMRDCVLLLLNNPLLSVKQKVAIVIFIVNPRIYNLIRKQSNFRISGDLNK